LAGIYLTWRRNNKTLLKISLLALALILVTAIVCIAQPAQKSVTGSTGFIGFIVFTLSGRKSEKQSRFRKNLKPALKSDDAFCFSSGKA
jgi:hypothetical protein